MLCSSAAQTRTHPRCLTAISHACWIGAGWQPTNPLAAAVGADFLHRVVATDATVRGNCFLIFRTYWPICGRALVDQTPASQARQRLARTGGRSFNVTLRPSGGVVEAAMGLECDTKMRHQHERQPRQRDTTAQCSRLGHQWHVSQPPGKKKKESVLRVHANRGPTWTQEGWKVAVATPGL